MKKHLFFTLLFLVLLGLLAGQTWVKRLPVDGLPSWQDNGFHLSNVIPAIGGGYLVQGFGMMETNDGNEADVINIIWKLNAAGNVLQRKTITTNPSFIVSLVSNGTDRYYCLAEDSYGDNSTLIVLDTGLNLLGSYHFGTVNDYYAELMYMQYAGDGLVFAGLYYGIKIIKTDFQLNVIWLTDPVLIKFDPCALEPYGSGWVCSTMDEFMHVSASGEVLWTLNFGVEPQTVVYDCTVSSDNRVFSLGYHKLFEMDMTEHELSLLVPSITGGFDSNFRMSIDTLPNGNIVYTGASDTGEILHCISADGEHQWSKSYNTHAEATYLGIGRKNLLTMPDGSILFPLYSDDGTYSYLIKTDSQGNAVANDDPITPAIVTAISARPNPFKDELLIEIKSTPRPNSQLEIYNIKGQKVKTIALDPDKTGEQSTRWDGRDAANKQCANGVYFIKLLENGTTASGKKVTLIR
ncbi:MAG: FlgD immunoglobulin-like domain containing protein [Candidatus Cloacimonadaceae bacterium]|jgi:hypothetical protein